MQRNTSVTLGDHFRRSSIIKIADGRYESTSEAIRAGLRLLEAEETKLEMLRVRLLQGQKQLDNGEGVDGETFMRDLIG